MTFVGCISEILLICSWCIGGLWASVIALVEPDEIPKNWWLRTRTARLTLGKAGTRNLEASNSRPFPNGKRPAAKRPATLAAGPGGLVPHKLAAEKADSAWGKLDITHQPLGDTIFSFSLALSLSLPTLTSRKELQKQANKP